jgi:hypothetical protein
MLSIFKKKTLLDGVSALEAKEIIFSMIDDFMVIVSNDNLSQSIKECFGELKIPEGKTPKQYFEEINGNQKIADFLKSVMNYAYEPLLRILAKCFCTPYEKYSKKSLNEIGKDLLRFAESPFFSFFISAVTSAKAK